MSGKAPPPSDTSPLSTKELRTGHNKKHSEHETQLCDRNDRSMVPSICANCDARRLVEDQVCRLKRRCIKLERKLQDKEAEILSMQHQQLPLLMHETMRNLYSMENNHYDQAVSNSVLSQSALSSVAHKKQDTDALIHEYEQQIAKLYEENKQEKLKSEMLKECLRDQKHAKAKLLKACKHAKQKFQDVKDSGLSQMLVDIEARCDALEKEKARIANELLSERSLREKQESEKQILTKQIHNLHSQSSKWEAIVATKNILLQQSLDQIYGHQVTIENLKADLKLADRKARRSIEYYRADDSEEIERLKRIISVERKDLDETKKRLIQITEENDILRKKLASDVGSSPDERSVPACSAHETFNQVLVQVRLIRCKLHSLISLVKMFEELNFVDMNILDKECLDENLSSCSIKKTCSEHATQILRNVSEAVCYLSELQEAIESVCARLIGNTCALQ